MFQSSKSRLHFQIEILRILNSSFIKKKGCWSFSNNAFTEKITVHLIPPAGLNPTLNPVCWWYSLIARHITRPTPRVAFTLSFPVLVLMKSEPAIMQTREHWYTTLSFSIRGLSIHDVHDVIKKGNKGLKEIVTMPSFQ